MSGKLLEWLLMGGLMGVGGILAAGVIGVTGWAVKGYIRSKNGDKTLTNIVTPEACARHHEELERSLRDHFEDISKRLDKHEERISQHLATVHERHYAHVTDRMAHGGRQ